MFSPTRTEVALALTGGPGSATPAPKPNLYGVVLRDDALIAYLEDPATKRVADYRTGDTVAGGTVKLITADLVILARPEGPVEVRLNDPAKPTGADSATARIWSNLAANRRCFATEHAALARTQAAAGRVGCSFEGRPRRRVLLSARLLDDLIGTEQDRRWDSQPERLRALSRVEDWRKAP